MCSINEIEWPEFYIEKKQTARKKHVCCECDSDIDPGEEYVCVTGKWCGRISTYKTCETCWGIRMAAQAEGDKIPFECLYEIVGSEYDEAAA